MGAIAKFFSRSRPLPNPRSHCVDYARLDDSVQLLKTTTAEVSLAAVEAAKVLQSQLNDSNNRFFSTIDAIDDLVIVKDGQGRWNTVNEVGQKAFGVQPADYVGKTNADLAATNPVYRDCLALCDRTDLQAWETKTPTRSEEYVPLPGGGDRWFDVIKTPVFNEDGSRKELIVVGRDITEHRVHNQRMKACFLALNSASDPIVILDSHANVFFCNDMFVRTVEAANYDELIGQSINSVLHIGDAFDNIWQTIQANQTWEGCIPYDGKYMCNISIVPVMNGVPLPIYFICTIKKRFARTSGDMNVKAA